MNQYKKIFKENLINKKYFFIGIIIVYFFLTFSVVSKESNYFSEGIKLYNKKEFSKSKVFFEKDIVFNPKSENGYMYLAKIYLQESNDEEQETNLNNVLLINPQNDEAIYMLTLLKIKYSDYDKAKELIENFDLICKSFCSKKKEMHDKLKKLTPKDEKNNN